MGACLIDAHAGGLASIGAGDANPERRVTFVTGTSNCVMAVSAEPRFVPGVWGPYFDAMVPGLWLAEGGQSAAGAATDYICAMHPAWAAHRETYPTGALAALERDAIAMAGGASEAATLARDLHVVVDILGNRSPHADPAAGGVIAGLRLDSGHEGLVRLYAAVQCGLAAGAADILDAMSAQGFEHEAIVMTGGAARSALVRTITADATGRPVVVPETSEPVLLGAAMLGAVAGGIHADLPTAMETMSRDGARIEPNAAMADFHKRKRDAHEGLRLAENNARETMAT